MRLHLLAAVVLLRLGAELPAQETMRLPKAPALSPDGKTLAFEWNEDIWLASAAGGETRQLTTYAGRDSQPKFSPDGQEVAFVSDREGGAQVFVVGVQGGTPRQITFHSGGQELQEWSPDGKHLLIKANRDHFWRHPERFLLIPRSTRSAEQLVFDDYGSDGVLSPDGKKILFTREGEPWWRKGYQGSRVVQIWMYDLEQKQFTKLLHKNYSCRWPLWRTGGTGFYFVQDHAKGSNLWEYDLATKEAKQRTQFVQDSVVFPCIARSGSALVFRHLFDFYRYTPANQEVSKLDLWHHVDRVHKKHDRRMLTSASSVAFSSDGLEMAFIAGGDLWVMDTEMREPVPVTKTAEEESSPVFTRDGKALLFISGAGGQPAVWKAVRKDPKKFWWRNPEFVLTKLTEFDEVPARLRLSPDGNRLAYTRGRGDLWISDADGKNERRLFAGWDPPEYEWSPDGKWLAYAVNDTDFNHDVWILAADGGKPYNVSRHPFNEGRPAWSPDGKYLAFAGQRAAGEPSANLCVVALRVDDDETTERDRKLEKALEKMKARLAPTGKPALKEEPKTVEKKPVEVSIDFEHLHERVKRISLPDGSASAVFWSPDSKKLAFVGYFEGKSGTYTIDMGEKLVPKQLTTVTGSQPVWMRSGNQIVWLVGGVPTSTLATPAPSTLSPTTPTALTAKPLSPFAPKTMAAPSASAGSYTFNVRQEINAPARQVAVFDTCWQTMRDHWYDSNLGNNDWSAVRAKYRDLAARVPDLDSVNTLVQLMLGELNGSHLGFALNPTEPSKTASLRDPTVHLGVRFDPTYAGPGLKIRDVLPHGPADKKRSRLRAGEIIVQIDGTSITPQSDLTQLLNRPADREVSLRVKDQADKERDVSLLPIPFFGLLPLLYEQWLRHNREQVEESSGGKLGYVHVSAMNMPNFRKFEEELFSQGSGKMGLVIDVRENGGGFTADHMLTALTQPVHAIAVPRGGGPGYPQDRKVYATWNKPIVVLCNQNSYSNAEIFSHAIKTLKRGQLVGTPTAGGVVSTGAVPIMDVGLLRLPFRGWFVLGSGEDMELNGAVPHHVIWPAPGQMPAGKDSQLERALEVLQADVRDAETRPQPSLRKATERKE